VKRGNPGLRLRLPRIERKPKPVYIQQFQDFAGVGRVAALQDELDDIIESIERGDGVPERHYRAGIDRDEDMLAAKGIMHLHLGGKNSDVLVFLIQYSDRIVLLETNSHMHLSTRPAGKTILALTQAWLNALEAEMQRAAAQAQAAAGEAARERAESRRAALAASIAAFKAKAKLK
jgi:hypothetical protein